MDYQNFNYIDKRSSNFATASFIMGVIGIATGCCIYTGIICGALAIMFALLSKGGEHTIHPRGKLGLTLGIVRIALGILIFVIMLAVTISSFGSFESFWYEYKDILNELDTAYPYTL